MNNKYKISNKPRRKLQYEDFLKVSKGEVRCGEYIKFHTMELNVDMKIEYLMYLIDEYNDNIALGLEGVSRYRAETHDNKKLICEIFKMVENAM